PNQGPRQALRCRSGSARPWLHVPGGCASALLGLLSGANCIWCAQRFVLVGAALSQGCRGVGRDLRGNELRIVLDPAEERRAARVLPRQTEEVKTKNVSNSAKMANVPL